jgi:hypothetical protein
MFVRKKLRSDSTFLDPHGLVGRSRWGRAPLARHRHQITMLPKRLQFASRVLDSL